MLPRHDRSLQFSLKSIRFPCAKTARKGFFSGKWDSPPQQSSRTRRTRRRVRCVFERAAPLSNSPGVFSQSERPDCGPLRLSKRVCRAGNEEACSPLPLPVWKAAAFPGEKRRETALAPERKHRAIPFSYPTPGVMDRRGEEAFRSAPPMDGRRGIRGLLGRVRKRNTGRGRAGCRSGGIVRAASAAGSCRARRTSPDARWNPPFRPAAQAVRGARLRVSFLQIAAVTNSYLTS